MHQDVRPAVAGDAAQLFHIMKQVQGESRYTLLQKEEGVGSVHAQQLALEQMAQSKQRCVFVALDGERIVGYAGVTRGAFARCSHVASIMIAVCREDRRRGHGRRLISAVETWSRGCEVRRLELTVVGTNAGAIALYEATGFVREGIRHKSFVLDDQLVDELYMAKILPPPAAH